MIEQAARFSELLISVLKALSTLFSVDVDVCLYVRMSCLHVCIGLCMYNVYTVHVCPHLGGQISRKLSDVAGCFLYRKVPKGSQMVT